MTTPSIYLLSTAALPAELVEEAAAKAVVLDTMSFIATELAADEETDVRIRALGDRRLTAVFTSGNAVEAVGHKGGRDWVIYCTGGVTRKRVAERFGEEAIAGTAESAAELAEVVIVNARRREIGEGEDAGAADTRSGGAAFGQDRKEIFFFCGDQRRDELPDLLKEAGLTVHEVVVYRTLLTPQKVQRDYAGIAFFSPSAVESYFSLNTVANDVTLFAIGRTTAAAIQARCSHPVIISDRPGKDALIRTMTDHFQTNNKE